MATAVSKTTTAKLFSGKYTVEKYQIHPREAQTWVNEAQYERQRTVRGHHIDFLFYLIRTGQLRPGTEIARARYVGRDYIINGNHTLWAIARGEKPLWITLVTYHVESMEEIDRLYVTYDRQLPRNPRDMLKAYGFAEHSGLNQRQSEVLFSSMRLVLSGFVHAAPRATKDLGYLRDNELLYTAALEWIDEATEFSNDIAGVPKRWHDFLMRQSLMAVAIVQYRNEPGRAEEFWKHIAKEDHADPQHSTRQFARWCANESHKVRTSHVEYAYAAAHAWNLAYTDIKARRSFAVPSTEVPIHMEGTPHSRAKVMRYIDKEWKLLEDPVEYDDPKMRRGSHALV